MLTRFTRPAKSPAARSAIAVSVVIPAYNAADTLGETLDCLIGQTVTAWEAIVVDDGSSDDTVAVGESYALQDPRIRVARQSNQGPSPARNLGISLASGDWLLFLDADDWVSLDFLDKMLAAAARQPSASAVYCFYSRVTPDGRRLPQDWYENVARAPFESFARGCPPAIHSVIARRPLVVEVGGFDATLLTCEDWDLWQKIARAGAQFVEVPETLAFYRMRAGSHSMKTVQMLKDGLIVSARAWGADPRVPSPHPDHAAGRKPSPTEGSLGYFLCWCAGELAAQGEDSGQLFEALTAPPEIGDRVEDLVDAVVCGILIGCEGRVGAALAEWPRTAGLLDGFFAELETRLGRPGLARRAKEGLRVRMTHESISRRPRTLAASMALDAITAVSPGPDMDTVAVSFKLPGEGSADIKIPAWGVLSERDIARAATDAVDLRRLLKTSGLATSPAFWATAGAEALRSAEPLVRSALPGDVTRKRRLKSVLGRVLREAVVRSRPAPSEADGELSAVRARALMTGFEQRTAAQEAAGAEGAVQAQRDPLDGLDPTRDPQAYFERLFETEDPWDYTNAYETLKYQQTLSLVPQGPIANAMEIACAEGIFTRMLAGKVGRLTAVDISSKALERAAGRCADLQNVSFQQLNLVQDAIPAGLDLLVCSEVLYYLVDEKRLRRVAEKMAQALAPGGRLLTAHAFQLTDDPTRTGFDWGDPYGADTISRVFGESGLSLERSIVTELYRIDLFRRGQPDAAEPEVIRAPFAQPLDEGVARHVVWGGAVARRADLAASRTFEVPVLMYHRIADDGPAALADYRVSKADFDAQLRLLRRHGYHSISSTELTETFARGKAFAGRPVLITFDDGYQDFADAAWPILKRNDFSAEVFIVTDKVGGRSDWDSAYGETAPLMDWPTIQALSAEGVVFGSHLATHRAVDVLSPNELLEEAYRSRRLLETKLGGEVRSLAAPFGAYDDRLPCVLRLCGYNAAFSTQDGRASMIDDPLHLPRIEVSGGMSLQRFAKMLGLPPEANAT